MTSIGAVYALVTTTLYDPLDLPLIGAVHVFVPCLEHANPADYCLILSHNVFIEESKKCKYVNKYEYLYLNIEELLCLYFNVEN